jgi:hypothetical protein
VIVPGTGSLGLAAIADEGEGDTGEGQEVFHFGLVGRGWR